MPRRVRTRFAPSPTGFLHIGNVRTALFAYLYAKHCDGDFVLRIEDTDQERSQDSYVQGLMDDLHWLGIEWDEGPLREGNYGPYFQMKRMDIYARYAQRLVDTGYAFPCYCSEAELEQMRVEAEAQGRLPHYNGRCRHLSHPERQALEAEGRVPSIRFMASEKDMGFHDLVKGDIQFPKGMVGDFVILRANKVPIYNFAVVVDDITMEISHVIRADEHLSNMVRQLMLFEALGSELPQFAHLGLVLGPDQKKLSKRHGATSVREFREAGYLPESLMNALVLLGWSSPDGKETFDQPGLIKRFDLDRVSGSPSIFDTQKLHWLGKHHIIDADPDRIFEMACTQLLQADLITHAMLEDVEQRQFLKQVIQLTKGYCAYMQQINAYVEYFITDAFSYTEEAESWLTGETNQAVLRSFYEALAACDETTLNEEWFTRQMQDLQSRLGLKGKKLFMPLRAALSGRTTGPEMYHLLPVIGKQRALTRLERKLQDKQEQ